MSAVGIDFGNENCYIAVARAGGIETITNDYSQRATPSYVAFGSTRRDIGTSAKNKFITNLKNTINGFKRLIGKNFKDPLLNFELTYLPYSVHELPNGSIGVKVSYLGNDVVFTVPQITAMLMTKLKHITETAVGMKMSDCVISVPIYFTDNDRRTMLDICKIAGLNVLRLLNEPTAVALAYGFYRQDLSEDKPKKVAFVDIGHSAAQTSICEFYKGRLKVLASAHDYSLGGRDIDNRMVRHFSEEFKAKYNLNVLSNNRVIVRLLQECEKLKTQLSANPHVLPLNIECFMDDLDVSSSLGREKLEEMCADILDKIENLLRKLIFNANLHPGELSAVEIVGGTTRMPAVKNIIKKVFGMEPSTTLNLDEAIAKGCALQAAMLSPGVKAREFFITDLQPHTIKLLYDMSKPEPNEAEVFPLYHPVPFSKLYTFFRKEDFILEAVYVPKEKNFPLVSIGSFKIKNVSQSPSGESSKIIVKVRVNIHGIFTVCSAVMVDKDFKENPTLDQRAEDLMDIQMKNCAIPLDSQITEEKRRDFFSLKKHKKSSPGVELQVEAKVSELTESELKTFVETEQKMILHDLDEEKRINAKNSVEEFVYELRGLLTEELKNFIDNQERDDFLHTLSTIENWLYEEGEEQPESVYKEKLNELKRMAEPIFKRKYEDEQRLSAIAELQNLIQSTQKILESYLTGSQQYAHIEPKKMEMVQQLIDEKKNWLEQQMIFLKDLKQYENPPVFVEHFINEHQQLKQEILPILNTPVPPPENPDTKSQSKSENIKC